MAEILLEVRGLKVAYGGIQAVKGVDFEVREGELVSLIGSNGAGKTTTMKAITGSLPFIDGDIKYLGQSIRGKGAWDLVRQGLAMVPEGRGVFTRMTTTENLQMGAHTRNDKPETAKDWGKVLPSLPRLPFGPAAGGRRSRSLWHRGSQTVGRAAALRPAPKRCRAGPAAAPLRTGSSTPDRPDAVPRERGSPPDGRTTPALAAAPAAPSRVASAGNGAGSTYRSRARRQEQSGRAGSPPGHPTVPSR